MQASDFAIKGWCPGALRPMQSGDGLVVRIRPRMAQLTADQLRGIAEAALTHGNGVIELTARANVQLRGITSESHPALIAALDKLGLIDPDTQTESHRNVVLTPFWQDEPTRALTAALYAALRSGPDLPGKFGFAVDTGTARVLAQTSADIRIERSAGGLILRADGKAGGQAVTFDNAVAEALRMAEWFVASGGVRDGRGRMAPYVAQAALPFDTSQLPVPALPASMPGLVAEGALVGFEFGILRAETLAKIARLAPMVRVTPWRMLLLCGAGLPALAGVITEADDPRLRVIACTGKPGCPQALQETRSLARRLAKDVPVGKLLHVSGCGKGCAHPAAAWLTLSATPRGFAVIPNGRAGAGGTLLPASEINSETLRKAM